MPISILTCIGGLVVGAIVAGLIAFKMGIAHRQKTAEAVIGSAEQEAERIVKEAALKAESKRSLCWKRRMRSIVCAARRIVN